MAVSVAGCGEEVGFFDRPLVQAYCFAMVTGVGMVEVETDYLPSVVACENGAADFEALKVQAVAARSYLYYRLDNTGEIQDGTGDQVYTCARPAQEIHQLAVEATSGLVLTYRETQVAAFYVAGALQDPPTCRGGTDDPTSTEQFVTYNEGLSGDNLIQTPLGFVAPGNFANRGCMSQNGSDCLSERGMLSDEILRFYYGTDIGIEKSQGDCIVGDPIGPDAGGPIGPDASDDGGGDLNGGCGVGGRGPLWAFGTATMIALALRRRRRTY